MSIPTFTRAQLTAGAPGPETALTIGVLDGVHLGHQALLGRLRQEARKRALSPGVVTLHPHPITVLRPEVAPSYLTSLEDRIELMRDAGADWVIPLTFTGEVSEVTAEELAGAFHRYLRMRLMVLGPDAAFGRGAPKDTFERMQSLGADLGFGVIQVEPLMHDHERYSSTAVRKALADGDMDRVTALLGRNYRISGPVVKGFERGRTIGIPTANISIAVDRALPALGVYATRVHVAGHTLLGGTNIGRRPTFDAGHVSIETHLLDFEGDIYGERMDLEVVARIRGEMRFENVETLKAQIRNDIARVREILR
ncbi:MAG: riboflavin biosynthesis protein RibF [Chloroflexi bacterium]|nr:riboflavin biosynthesis protein RibF [Dehalococcoidia bacterium]MCO5200998.1 riboflavin biosynthesis protein RibF [Chloroflexota bacterium]MCZ7578883.1 riboflavin biosynthesis protein RibF [Dehalococcoidia bacterium]NJD65053.1 riboflavin biosynthesis protein RibF [Chloroflexota bacterium]